jgi:hypothetical protein
MVGNKVAPPPFCHGAPSRWVRLCHSGFFFAELRRPFEFLFPADSCPQHSWASQLVPFMCCAVLLSREWGDPFPWLSQQ